MNQSLQQSETGYDHTQEYPHHRLLVSGAMVAAYRTVTGNGRLIYCTSQYDAGPSMSWCYSSLPDAIRAMEDWAEESLVAPDGWHREIHTGRRRVAGDPDKEYYTL
jgi:hypothetical protein